MRSTSLWVILLLLAVCPVRLYGQDTTTPLDAEASADSPDSRPDFLSNAVDALAVDQTTSNGVTGDSAAAETLLAEALDLFASQNMIDARSKLLQALKKDPTNYRVQMYLGIYYLSEVGHFRLAFNYLAKALELFEAQHSGNPEELQDDDLWKVHAKLLLLMTEAYLNLDNYEEALATINRFEASYSDSGSPATKAWILMKLRRIEEGIKVAQYGLFRGASKGRTYNVLGVLFSLVNNHDLALNALAQAVKAESALGSYGDSSAPLNNIGEIYREIFREDYAEVAWIKSIATPMGCDHILSSMNYVLLLIDQLRLDQASKVLEDFQRCFSQDPIRSDTEHRALAALGNGKIALRKGQSSKALELLNKATREQQWFGKIGTTTEDVKLASSITIAETYQLHSNVLKDRIPSTWREKLLNNSEREKAKILSWWYFRRARLMAIEQLNDFEDLYIRNTDAMLEYPTLGAMLAGLPLKSLSIRLERMTAKDSRPDSRLYYTLYYAQAAMEHGKSEQALAATEQMLSTYHLPKEERLLRAQLLVVRILAIGNKWFFQKTTDNTREIERLTIELFDLAPSLIRQHDLTLPVASIAYQLPVASGDENPILASLADNHLSKLLLSTRLKLADTGSTNTSTSPFSITVYSNSTSDGIQADKITIGVKMTDTRVNRVLCQYEQVYDMAEQTSVNNSKLINGFVDSVFTHHEDMAVDRLPGLPLLEFENKK